MRMMRGGIAPDDNLLPRNFEVDTDTEQIALLMTRVLALDDDAARYDPLKEAFELHSALTYSRRDGVGRIHVAKRDLKRELHGIFPSTGVGGRHGRHSAAPRSSRLRVLRMSAGSSQPRRACSTA